MKHNSPIFITLIAVLPVFTSCIKKCECHQPQDKTLTAQPGPTDGQDCIVITRTASAAPANTNQNSNPDIIASAWTYNAEGLGDGINRTYFRFPTLSDIPQNATIKSA